MFTAETPAQAHLVAGLLEEQGIRTFVEGEMLFGVRGDLGLTASSLPKISVRDEDADRALELIGAREGKMAAERADEDEDAAPRPPKFRRAASIVVLWTLIGAVAAMATGFIALPVIAVACFVHLYVHLDRAS